MVRFGAKKVNSRSPFFFGAKLRGGELRQQRGVSYPLKLSFTFFFWPKSPGWRAATAARRFPPSRTLVHLFYFNFPGRLQPISHALVHSFIFFPRCCNQSFPLKHLFTFFTSRSGEATKYHALVHSFIFFPRCCNQSILPSQTLVHLFYFTLPWRLQPISRDLVHSFIFFPCAATKVFHPLKLSFTFFLVQISGVANRNSSTPDNCCHFTHQNPGVLKRFYYYVLWPDSALLFEVLVSKAISFSKQSSG